MGVDWYTCSHCGDTYCDAGHYGTCSNCEDSYCGHCYDKFADKYGTLTEEDEKYDWFGGALKECDHCNGTIISGYDLMNFALSMLGLTHQELEQKYREKHFSKEGMQ